jgi:hypothetical protein
MVAAALLALLGAAGWYAYQGLIVPGDPMPRDGYIALSRRGYEPPTFTQDE